MGVESEVADASRPLSVVNRPGNKRPSVATGFAYEQVHRAGDEAWGRLHARKQSTGPHYETAAKIHKPAATNRSRPASADRLMLKEALGTTRPTAVFV